MEANRKPIVTELVIVVLIGALACHWWPFSRREFRGRLVYRPYIIVIPEISPPTACLVTASETYDLDLGMFGSRWSAHKRRRGLEGMNGKEVIVRGIFRLRRGSFSKHRIIRVEYLSLSTPGTLTAPADGNEGGPNAMVRTISFLKER